MAYLVEMSASATRDADNAYQWIYANSPRDAVKWYNGLVDQIISLEELPTRCIVARESAKLGREIRQLVYGHRQYAYRILFEISGETVRILRIWRGARDRISHADIE